MAKERDHSIDFLRALCALGIVLFHFYCHTPDGLPRLFYSYANGSVGNTLVNVFFIISGYALYLNNPEIKDLKAFYKKRFRSIFPVRYCRSPGLLAGPYRRNPYNCKDSLAAESGVFNKGVQIKIRGLASPLKLYCISI